MSSDQNEGDLCRVAVLRHFGMIAVDGVETGLALQAEDEDDGVDPGSELFDKEKKRIHYTPSQVNTR